MDVPEGPGDTDCKDPAGERQSEMPPVVSPLVSGPVEVLTTTSAPGLSLVLLGWGAKLYWSSVGTEGWLNWDSVGPVGQ